MGVLGGEGGVEEGGDVGGESEEELWEGEGGGGGAEVGVEFWGGEGGGDGEGRRVVVMIFMEEGFG